MLPVFVIDRYTPEDSRGPRDCYCSKFAIVLLEILSHARLNSSPWTPLEFLPLLVGCLVLWDSLGWTSFF